MEPPYGLAITGDPVVETGQWSVAQAYPDLPKNDIRQNVREQGREGMCKDCRRYKVVCTVGKACGARKAYKVYKVWGTRKAC